MTREKTTTQQTDTRNFRSKVVKMMTKDILKRRKHCKVKKTQEIKTRTVTEDIEICEGC